MLRIVASCKAAFLVEQIVPSQESKCEKKLIIDCVIEISIVVKFINKYKIR